MMHFCWMENVNNVKQIVQNVIILINNLFVWIIFHKKLYRQDVNKCHQISV